VKKSHWITFIVGIAIVLGIYAIPAITQQSPPAAPQIPYLVAIIDVAQVIKQHPDYVSRQQELTDRVNAAEANFSKRRDNIANKQKSLEGSQLRPGSPEHQRALDDIANDLAEFEKDAKTQQRKFGLESSNIMYDVFQDIKGTIKQYASTRGIAQVTDYRQFEVHPADPQTVAEDMDQRLVWFDSRLDITQVIIGQIYAARNMQPPQQVATGGATRSASNAPAPAGSQPTQQR